MSEAAVAELESTRKFFLTTIAVLNAEHEAFAPHADMYTTAGHVAHVAITVDWFMGGAFGAGWDTDYDVHIAQAKAVTSFDAARAMLEHSFEQAIATLRTTSEEELNQPIPNDIVMGGAPRRAVISGIVDHTAHHRGSLAVYARLCGKVPTMPYA